MRKFYVLLIAVFFAFASNAQNVTVAGAVAGNGSYPTLGAAFTAINGGAQTGAAITVSIVGNTTEAASAVLNAGAWTSLTISPSGGAARTITGALAAPLIDLNGADNVSINGLNSGGNSLTISNTSTSNLTNTSTIRFIGDASSNSVLNCTISGSSTSITLGTIFFSTGTATGNDNNTISNCNIGPAGANLAVNNVYSAGTATFENSGNTITACNISDFFSATLVTNGILIAGNNTDWTISNNKIFQSATRTYTTANTHRAIQVTSGNNYTITGNTIGYATSGATGVYTMAGTIATRFIGIDLAVGTTTATTVQGNTIAAISLTTSSGATTTNGILCGINVTAGNVTINNNTIGSSSGTGSLLATSSTALGAVVGINSSSTGTIAITNNILGAFTSTGTTATIAGSINAINVSGAAASMTITGNTIGNSTANNMLATASGTSTGATVAIGINATSVCAIANFSNNTIQNFASNGTGSGNVRGIFTSTTSSTTASYTISNNIITNLFTNSSLSGATSGLTAGAGIHLFPGINGVVANNTISNIAGNNATSVGTVITGISCAQSTSPTVSGNTIFNISNASTTTSTTLPGVAAGITIRSGTTAITVVNNMISLGTGQTTNTVFIGIWGNHGSTPNPIDNIYFNSVNIEGTAASGAQPSFGFLRGDFATTAKTATVDIRNNIFKNTRSGGTGGHYAISNNYGATTVSTTGWGAGASDYNILIGGTANTVGQWTTDQTFAGWQAASAGDGNSQSAVTVNFVNAASGDLHISGINPPIESAGINIPSVTVDYDNQVRANFTPTDIGADAGNFFNFPIINFTPLAPTCVTGARTLIATITDPDGVPTAGIGLPVLYWRINAGAYTAATGTFIGSDQYQFTFGAGAVTGDVIYYYIAAQDNVGNSGTSPAAGAGGFSINPPAAATPPTSPRSFAYQLTLSGTYTVGVGGNYPTLTAAVNAYNNNCLGGAVIFSLIDATYPSETFPITINQHPQASAVNTLTIKPANGVSPTISGTVASGAILRIFGNYVTVDGSNSGGTSRDLTLTNTSTTSPSVVVIGSTGTTPIMNSTLKNCVVINGGNTATAVIVSDGAAPGTAGYFSNITVQNNNIQKAYIGIYSIANPAAGNGNGLLITGNDLTTSGANSIRLAAIYVQGVDGATVSNNTIGNIANTADASNVTGIWFATSTVNSTISNNTINGMSGTSTGPRGMAISSGSATAGITITGNTIKALTSSTSQAVSGIYVFSTTGGVTIEKNKISDIKNTSTTSTGSYGLNLAATGTTFNVVNNFIADVASYGSATSTANGNGIMVAAGSGYAIQFNSINMNTDQTFATGIPAAINITSGVTAAGAIDLRNNIFNSSQTVGANRYAIYSGAANTVYSVIDYNDYFTTGPNLGFIGSDRATLGDIQTGFGGNANSLNVAPVFNSATDLHLHPASNPGLNNLGVSIGGITTDIDGDTRGANPDMGADEFTPCGPAATATASSNSPVCEGGTLNLTGTTNGTVFSWTGPNGFTSTQQNPSISNVTTAAAGTYSFQAWLAGCPSLVSSTTVVVNNSPIITSVTATPTSVCLNGSSQLNVNLSPATTGYIVNNVPFVPIASGAGTITLASAGTATTALTSGTLDDGYWNGIAIPFPFTYYGTAYNTINVQTNGVASFSAFTTTTGYGSTPHMPNTATPNNILGVFADMEWRFGGVISCYTSGVAPNRIFVLNYDGSTGGGFYNSGSAPTALVNYQIQLFENGNKVQFHTTSITPDASHNHTMGIEDAGGNNATVAFPYGLWALSNNGTEITLNNLTYLWTPSTFLNDPTIANPLASNITATTVYTVQVTQSNGCPRTGNVTVTLNPAPTAFNVTGGGNYCTGGSGVVVGLSGSESGVNYQLYVGASPVGSPVAGTGSAISFGLQAAAGTYTVVGTNTTTTCTGNMSGSVTITIDPLPTLFTVTGGGAYCSGGAGSVVGLSGSESGVNYQLLLNSSPVGSPVAGTGSAISFGAQTAAGTYTVAATNATTGCNQNMTGSVTVSIDPLPTQYTVTGGGSYCAGGSGVAVGLSGSESGVNYQLFLGASPTGSPVSGTGSAISFGLQTAAGTYTVVATNASTLCTENMLGSVNVTVNPLPVIVTNFIIQPSTCVSNDGAIDINIVGAAGPFTYAWSTVGGSGLVPGQEDQSGLSVGQYTVVVTDNITGCQKSAVFNLTGPGGCAICPFIGSVTTNPATPVCANQNVTITASGLVSMGVTYGITFKYSNAPLADPYTGGTVIGTVPNGSLGGGGTTASITTSFPAGGTYYIYAILSPTPIDPLCRPSGSLVYTVNPLPIPYSVIVAGGNPAACPAYGAWSYARLIDVNNGGAAITNYRMLVDVNTQALIGAGKMKADGSDMRFLVSCTEVPFWIESGLNTASTKIWVKVPSVAAASTTQVQMVYGNPAANFVVPNNASNVFETGLVALYTFTEGSGTLLHDWVGGFDLNLTGSATWAAGFRPGVSSITGFTGGGRVFLASNGPALSNGSFTVVDFVNATNPNGTTQGMVGNYNNDGVSGWVLKLQGGATQEMLLTNESGSWCQSSAGSVTAGQWKMVGARRNTGVTNTLFVDGLNVGNICAGDARNVNNSGPFEMGRSYNGVYPFDGNVSLVAIYNTSKSDAEILDITRGIYPVTQPAVSVGAELMNTTQYICSGSNAVITLTGSEVGVNYQLIQNGSPVQAPQPGTGSPINWTVSGLAVGTYNFTVEATNATTGCFNTMNGTATVIVNPVPTVNAVSNQTVCNGQPTTAVTFSGSVPGTVFNWTNNAPGIGLAASGTGNIASFTAVNATAAPIVATITVTPSYTAGGTTCNGTPITFTITVNPTPDAVATPASQTVCSGIPITTIVLSGSVSGTTYSWTRNNTGTVTGIAASGTGNINGTLTNTTTAPVTVTFTITPSANGCPGTPITATVLVNPTPNAVATPSTQTICSGNAMTTIVLSGNVSGTTYSWTRNNTVNVTGIPNSGTGNISGTPINNTGTQQTVIFTITPSANGCPGTPVTATLIINIGPAITCPANITVNNTPGQCGAIVNYPPATATGSPAPVITYSQASGTFFPVGTTTVTATATNSCGTATCTFTITVVDAQPPTILCPANITVNNTPGVCGANVTYPFPTVGDNCSLPGGTPVTLSQTTNNTTITPIQIGCQYPGGVTASNSWWRAYNLAPMNLPAGLTIKSVRFGIEKITGTTVPITARIYTSAGTFPGAPRTLLATQTANFAPQTGTFGTITFSSPALVQSNAIVVVELFCPDQLATGAGFFIGSNALGESGPSYLSATACGVANPTPIADLVAVTDHILLNINAEYYTSAPTLVQIAGIASGGLFPVGTTTNTFRATDAAGNTSTCSFTVTVNDAQAPTITCPNNIVRNTDPGVCTATIAVPNPTYNDNCAVTKLTWVMSGATTGSSPATGINFVGTQTFNLNGQTGQGITTIVYTATDAAGNATTCSFTVTVNDAVRPIISTPPLTKFVCVGSNAVFSVVATTNGGPLAYQWQEWNGTAWANISGATNSSFTVNNVSFADNTRSFRVILTGLCSVATSAAATLYVNPLPTISLTTSIPPILVPGQSMNINAVASPTGGSYAWYFNGSLVPSRTGSSWPGVTVDGIGTYRVVYTDPNGCVNTSADLVVSGQESGGLWVYPNPNTGRFLVRFFNNANETVTINVFDSKGARVFQQVAPTGTAYTGITVDLGTDKAAGVYIVQAVNSAGKIVGSRRIIVRHP